MNNDVHIMRIVPSYVIGEMSKNCTYKLKKLNIGVKKVFSGTD